LSTDDTPLHAGLAFAVDWDKPGGFIGKAALDALRPLGVRKRLITFVLVDSEPVLWGGEPILRNGIPVGYTSSGSYGHTLGAAVGMGYVKSDQSITTEWVMAGAYEINVAGERFPATAHLMAPYDPGRLRILC
jgi:4-methylaminobutanoate oxidase (formaldehyde-forming)